MDSAYQSQSGASRRGAIKTEGQPRESRTRMSAQFVGSDIYSPALSAESYNAFPDQVLDIGQMQQTATSWDATEGSALYANYSTGQDFTQYSTAPIQRFNSSSTVNSSSPWVASEAPYQSAPFPYTPYSTGQTPQDLLFAPASQRQWNEPSYESERPVVRSASSYTVQQNSRRTSTHDSNFGAFVATPTSTTSIQFPQGEYDQSRILDLRNEEETQSQDGNDDISESEAAETKLEEERTKVARSHPLYQQLPDKDGKYRCPEEGKAGCTHKPTPLKCNYDKYVDSHLKPFRCNKKTCVGVQFSSTACLLRHEREAHGMHGHGARPHLCHFRDCERAVPGHGFPRRYNLFDHMKRVHQYDGPTTEPSPPVQGQAPRKPVSRKRKSSADDVNEKRSKVIKLSMEQQRQQRRGALRQEFLNKRKHLIEILTNLGEPNDLRDDIQLTKEVVGLHDICTKYREVSGG